MGFDHLVGSLEPGKQADLVCIDLAAIETQPLHHVVSQLVYAAGRQQVRDVWIAGVRKLEDYRLSDIDSGALLAKAREWRTRIAEVRSA
jgi:5-methylthioadenosine/S-adenosylhomocysteine deaminase